MTSKTEIEDRIVRAMREKFLQYSDEVLEKYKDQINARLSTKGSDVAKATREWEARQEQAATQATPSPK